MDPARMVLIGVLVLVLLFILLGIRKIPIGAVGVLISIGRRTGRVRGEGGTWVIPFIQRLEPIYLRERQVDIPNANYFIADRGRISFKTTARVKVQDPVALFDQGPGTYGPFAREGHGDANSGSEESNVALRGLIQNAIRETVQGLDHQAVLSGGAGSITDLIRQRLSSTCQRWGLTVVDVWLTDLDAESPEMKSAMESQLREEMSGRGRMAGHLADIRKGALILQVAQEMAAQIEQQTGRPVDPNQVQQFLAAQYHNDEAMEVAMASAGRGGIMGQFYMQQFGMPMPVAPAHMPQPNFGPAGPGGLPATSGGGGPTCAACGSPNLPGSHFCDNCGGPLASGTPTTLPASQPSGSCPDGLWTVGREADIIVQGQGVSRRHINFEVRGGSPSVTDLGSSNGTCVGGQPITPNTPFSVSVNDTIQLGNNAQVQISFLMQAAAQIGSRTIP